MVMGERLSAFAGEREREIVGVSLACGVRSEIMNAVVVVSK